LRRRVEEETGCEATPPEFDEPEIIFAMAKPNLAVEPKQFETPE
jgi:hypothetical protein